MLHFTPRPTPPHAPTPSTSVCLPSVSLSVYLSVCRYGIAVTVIRSCSRSLYSLKTAQEINSEQRLLSFSTLSLAAPNGKTRHTKYRTEELRLKVEFRNDRRLVFTWQLLVLYRVGYNPSYGHVSLQKQHVYHNYVGVKTQVADR